MFRFLGVCIAAAVIVPSAAFATSTPVTHTQRVSYADLDLTTARGQVQLRNRLRAATGKVCQNDREQNFALEDLYGCRMATWQSVRKQLKAATEFAMRNNKAAVVLAAR